MFLGEKTLGAYPAGSLQEIEGICSMSHIAFTRRANGGTRQEVQGFGPCRDGIAFAHPLVKPPTTSQDTLEDARLPGNAPEGR